MTGRISRFQSIIRLFFVSAGIIIYSSCTNKEEFTIGSNFTEDQTSLRVIDTFTVAVSTVMADSIATSATGILLAGSYSDTCFGKVESTGYFEPGYARLQPDDSYIFDSASVALVYSGYSYGDTTGMVTLNIYQLDEEISLKDNYYLYSRSDLKLSDNLIGSKSFYPEPHSTDTLMISVNAFGEKLFNMFRDDDPDVGSSELLTSFVKGFAVKTACGNSIIGFKADASELLLRFYYHVDGETVKKSTVSLPFGPVNKQFNSIHTDFSNTLLSPVTADSKATSSVLTGNIAYMQAMLGLYPKLTFPSLQDITYNTKWKILKAEIVFEPVTASYSTFALPDQLCLYQTDDKNKAGSVLSGSDGSIIYSVLTTDDMFNEETRYTIDITSYLNEELSDNYFDTNTGLLINLVSTDINKSFSRLMIECKNQAAKLRLYYLTY
jgi:hypothetical protein